MILLGGYRGEGIIKSSKLRLKTKDLQNFVSMHIHVFAPTFALKKLTLLANSQHCDSNQLFCYTNGRS